VSVKNGLIVRARLCRKAVWVMTFLRYCLFMFNERNTDRMQMPVSQS
jgi:hypothetical protein